jgi:CRP/FNR family cyclic AMP-dependent transcriptional regulator
MNTALIDYFKDEELLLQLEIVIFKKGEKILRSYDETNFFHVIKNGLVKLYVIDPRGKENVGAIYGPGDLFPLAWIIGAKRPSVSFQAITECEIYLLPLAFFRESLKNDLSLSNVFARKVVEQFALFASTVNNLALNRGRERLAYGLLLLAARFGEEEEGVTVLPPISKSDLAAAINMARESTHREIAKFEKRGAIEYNRSGIVIKDKQFLQKEIGKNIPLIFFDAI